MPVRHLALLAAALLLALSAPAVAQEMTAEQIIEKSTGNRSVENSIQSMTMKIYDSSGRARERKITSKIKSGEGGRSMSYVRFEEPEDYAGVQFLTITNPGAEDDQWLYMPANAILNRITGSSKKGSFLGSDFSFEDLSIGGSPDDGTHTLVGEESISVGGQTFTVYKVETIPKPELKSGYTKFISYVSKDDFVPRQIEFFDKKGALHKRLTLLEVRKDGELNVPIRTTMENVKRSTKTEIIVDEYKVDVPAEELPDEIFTPAYLESQG